MRKTHLYQLLTERLNSLEQAKQGYLLQGGKKGLEKESLRVAPDGRLAQTPHPKALGSTLTNPAITTDFSEALLELITPPFSQIEETFRYMEQIHQFVYANLDEELLWATSMPCIVASTESIPIGEYGSSNVGQMKHIYRRGLDVRYGRMMQAISGVHFNYSVSEEFWPIFQKMEGAQGPLQGFITGSYLGLARNVFRFEWLISYLFGSSPALCKSFVGSETQDFSEFDAHTFYEPYATSLRMSDIGYKTDGQSQLTVSYNSLPAYVAALKSAVTAPHQPYVDLGLKSGDEYQQLNTNILQIENEFYSSIRPKQITKSGEPPLLALRERGIRYVELRALDVNASDPLGVNLPQLRFLEAFLLFCLLHDSPALEAQERSELDQNQRVVVMRGREPQLQLMQNGGQRPLSEWATELLTKMEPICAMLDSADQEYSAALKVQQQAVTDPEQTPSARMLAQMSENNEPFYQLAMRLSKEHQQTFTSTPQDPGTAAHFGEMARESLEKQAQIEDADSIPFEEYLARYFAQIEA